LPSVEASVGRAGRRPTWLTLLYGIVVLSALALGLMLLQELIEVLEDGSELGHEQGLHDLAVFNVAWPVFVPSWLFTLAAGVVMLIIGAVRRARPLLRYSAWALGFCVSSAVVVALFAKQG
jgi:uncharacterized membrane protein YhaH (DUF805 family)